MAGLGAGLPRKAFPREGSSCGAKGKVQAYGQVKLLPAPQLLPESIASARLKRPVDGYCPAQKRCDQDHSHGSPGYCA